MYSAKKITLSLAAVLTLATSNLSAIAAPADTAASPKKPAAADKKDDKKEAAKTPEPVIENVISVSPEDLVKRPHDYLGKNVKFTANFFAFSNLALDYKPALKPAKTHLSLLVLQPGTHIPLSELKLAMLIPKEKDPQTELLAKLKDGDTIEIIGKEFSTALDDPWVEILKLKRIGGKDDDKDKKASADKDSKGDKAEKADKTDDKPSSEKDK